MVQPLKRYPSLTGELEVIYAVSPFEYTFMSTGASIPPFALYITFTEDESEITTEELALTSNLYFPSSGKTRIPFIYTLGFAPLTVNSAYSPSI